VSIDNSLDECLLFLHNSSGPFAIQMHDFLHDWRLVGIKFGLMFPKCQWIYSQLTSPKYTTR
jgi:hypothetical protein